MINITKKIICVSFFLCAFHLSAGTNRTQQNEANKIQNSSSPSSVAIHFGPGPNVVDGPQGETRAIKMEENNDNSHKQELKSPRH